MPLTKIADLANPDSDELEYYISEASKISDYYKSYVVQDSNSHERKPGIHASEISGCLRRLVYSIMGTERVERTAYHWRARFNAGHAYHGMIQRQFHRMADNSGGAMKFQDEVKISPDEYPLANKWNIQSSCDGIITLRHKVCGIWQDLIRIGLEIKTSSPDEFAKLQAPLDYHLDQGCTYQAVLDLPLMWYFYVNKGNQNITDSIDPYLVPFDPVLWASLEERFAKATALALEGQLPEREESMKCEFCSFSHECKPSYLQRKSRKPLISRLLNGQ